MATDSESSTEVIAGEDCDIENPKDGFIEVVSKRQLRHSTIRARAGGPLKLLTPSFPMDIFCWNLRGFNDKLKSSFRKWMKLNQPLFGSLIETHVKPEKAQMIIKRSFPDWSYATNYEFSVLGKI